MKTKFRVLLFIFISLSINVKSTSAITTNQSDNAVIFLRSFFKWYKTQYKYLDQMHIVKMDTSTNIPYRIDFAVANKYLSILKSSGYFSDKYINNYRVYLNKIDLTLQKTKQNDGTVDGLDFDPIMCTQEPESILEDLNIINLRIVRTTDNTVVVRLNTKYDRNGRYQLFYLSNINGKFLIDKIEFTP